VAECGHNVVDEQFVFVVSVDDAENGQPFIGWVQEQVPVGAGEVSFPRSDASTVGRETKF
jgi:hypothetical protein